MQVKLILVGGFLGAGKTTLLNYLSGKMFPQDLTAEGDTWVNEMKRDDAEAYGQFYAEFGRILDYYNRASDGALFGTSMPTTGLPGTGASMRMDGLAKARERLKIAQSLQDQVNRMDRQQPA